jgi:hypothetical protein
MKSRMASWICFILFKNCLLKHVIERKTEGRIEVMVRQGRRCKKILDDIKKCWCIQKWKRKHYHALYGKLTFGRGYGPVVRQTAEWMNMIGKKCWFVFTIGIKSIKTHKYSQNHMFHWSSILCVTLIAY